MMKRNEMFLIELKHLDEIWKKCYGVIEIVDGVPRIYYIKTPEFSFIDAKMFSYYPIIYNWVSLL